MTISRNLISNNRVVEITMIRTDLEEPSMNQHLTSLESNLCIQWVTTKLLKALGHANLWPLVQFLQHLASWVRDQVHLDVRHHLTNRMHLLYINTYCIRLWLRLRRKRKMIKLVKSRRISSYTKFRVLIWRIKLYLPAKAVSHIRYMSSFSQKEHLNRNL